MPHNFITWGFNKAPAFNNKILTTDVIDSTPSTLLMPYHNEFWVETYGINGTLQKSTGAGAVNDVITLTATPNTDFIFDHYETSSNAPKRGPYSGKLENNQYTLGYGDVKISAFFKYNVQTGRMLYLTGFDNVVNGIDTPITSKVGSTYDLKSADCNITTSAISSIDDSYQTSLNSAYGNKNCLVISPTNTGFTTNLFPVGSSKSSNYTVSYWVKDLKYNTSQFWQIGIPGNICLVDPSGNFYSGNISFNSELYSYSNYPDYPQYNGDYGMFLRNGAKQTAYNGASMYGTAVNTGNSYSGMYLKSFVAYHNIPNNWHYVSIEVQNNNIYRYFIDGVQYGQMSGTVNTNIISPFRVYPYFGNDYINTADKICIAEYCVRSGYCGTVVPTEPFV